MVAESERFAEEDKARRAVIETCNSADSVAAETEKHLSEFGEQLDKAKMDALRAQIVELRELSVKGNAGDESVTADALKEKLDAVQSSSLELFAKVYEKRAGEQSTSSTESTSEGATTDSTTANDAKAEEKK